MDIKRLTKVVGISSAILLVGLPVVVWATAQAFVKWQLPALLQEKSGHELVIQSFSFNPWTLRTEVIGLGLTAPDSAPLLAFEQLVLDVSALKLLTGQIHIEGLESKALKASFTLLPAERHNWQPLIEAFAGQSSTAEQPEQVTSQPPELMIDLIQLAEGELMIQDQRQANGFELRLQPINFELTNLSTVAELPQAGQFSFSAQDDGGQTLALSGQVDWPASLLNANLELASIDLANFAQFLEQAIPYSPPSGQLDASAHLRLGFGTEQLDFQVSNGEVKLSDLSLLSKQTPGQDQVQTRLAELSLNGLSYGSQSQSAELAQIQLKNWTLGTLDSSVAPFVLDTLELKGLMAKLPERHIHLERVQLEGLDAQVVRQTDGSMNVQKLLQAFTPPSPDSEVKPSPAESEPASSAETTSTSPAETESTNTAETSNQPPLIEAENGLPNSEEKAWTYLVQEMGLRKSQLNYQDETFQPGLNYTVTLHDLKAGPLTENLAQPVPLTTQLELKGGGQLSAQGQVVLADAASTLQIDLQDLPVLHAQPFIGSVAKLDTASGSLDISGQLKVQGADLLFKGQSELNNLLLNVAGTQTPFFKLSKLSVNDFEASTESVVIDRVQIKGLQTRLAIAPDKSTNLDQILIAAKTSTPAQAPTSDEQKKGTPLALQIKSLKVANSQLDFEDGSLVLPFGARIRNLEGEVLGIDTQSNKPGRLQFTGKVNQGGSATGQGNLNFADPSQHLQMEVAFKNVEMKDLTPYSATFASRKIESGLLALNLNYDIQDRQLNSNNQIVIEKLKLGDKVASPDAVDLPLDLAIALLQDSRGVIDIGLPIKGNLNDPGFEIGEVILKTVGNLFTKIVTTPFTLLGSLTQLPGGQAGGDLQTIHFAQGSADLAAGEGTQVAQMASALKQRPNLKLSLQAFWAESDREDLKAQIIKQKVFRQMGLETTGPSDLPELDFRDPKTKAALESVYAAQLGSKKLRQIENAFRQAHPNELPSQSIGDSLMGLFDFALSGQNLSDAEIKELQNQNQSLHQMLFNELKDRQAVTDDLTAGLARSRAQAIQRQLVDLGVDASRVVVQEVKEWDGPDEQRQAIQMDLIL